MSRSLLSEIDSYEKLYFPKLFLSKRDKFYEYETEIIHIYNLSKKYDVGEIGTYLAIKMYINRLPEILNHYASNKSKYIQAIINTNITIPVNDTINRNNNISVMKLVLLYVCFNVICLLLDGTTDFNIEGAAIFLLKIISNHEKSTSHEKIIHMNKYIKSLLVTDLIEFMFSIRIKLLYLTNFQIIENINLDSHKTKSQHNPDLYKILLFTLFDKEILACGTATIIHQITKILNNVDSAECPINNQIYTIIKHISSQSSCNALQSLSKELYVKYFNDYNIIGHSAESALFIAGEVDSTNGNAGYEILSKSIPERSAPQVGICFCSNIIKACKRNCLIQSGSFL